MQYRAINEKMSSDEILEYWFIKMVGTTDDFEFIDGKPFDDYDDPNDEIYIKCSDYDNTDNFSFISFTVNKSFVCFDLFTYFF